MSRRLLSLSLPLLILPALAACKEEKKDPPKLRKMEYKVLVDDRGRMLPEIELFDQHHKPVAVAPGSFTLTLSRPDRTVLCSVTRTLAKEDYGTAKNLKLDWQDATCPPDPAAEELRVALEVKSGDKPDDPKLAREKTTPTKFIYRHLAAKPAAPANGSGSSAGSGDAKMIAPVPAEAEASGSASGSGAGSSTSSATGSGSAAPGSAASSGSGAAKP